MADHGLNGLFSAIEDSSLFRVILVFVRDNPGIYDEARAKLAWKRIYSFLDRHLKH